MPVITRQEIAIQMVAQLRLLDPSASAEVGTPERKIIDTFAQALYDSQIDLDALSSGFDLEAKYGSSLDKFINLFGYARQNATYATGFVTFSRVTPSTSDIRIPANTTVQASLVSTTGDNNVSIVTSVNFATQYDVTLTAGSLSVIAPVKCITPGKIGNVAANQINSMVGTSVFGVTSVTNEIPTSQGNNAETDEELKIRFKNTVFRNIAGTEDQYLALAISTAYSSKANVVGPQSTYREYIQVPAVDDASAYDINGDSSTESGNGSANQYTTALSTIPYAKYIYSVETPSFVQDNASGTIFYRQGFDFDINYPPINAGDSYRIATVGLDDLVANAPNRPNVTFSRVYPGTNADVQAVRPNDVVLIEYSYLSEASRNDASNNIFNAVDVFVDGGNIVNGSAVTTRPTSASAFVDNSTSKYYFENYRRVGQPEKRPIIGNVLMPLFWQPVVEVPDQIVVGNNVYFKNQHYWPIEDISDIGGTVRSRNGIEWSTTIKGKAPSDSETSDVSQYTGKIITDASGDPVGGQYISIDNYRYDRNIVDLQAALIGSKQITTDVLAHKARKRYFKIDITVMYTPGASTTDTNNQIQLAVDNYLQSLYFGSAIQISDLLQVIHNVSGVDNVRWSSDTPNSPDIVRIFECDAYGEPLVNVTTERKRPGSGLVAEIQGIFLAGKPTSGSFKIKWGGNTTASLPWNVSASTIQTEISAISGIGGLSVTEDVRTNVGVKFPMRSFTVTWGGTGAKAQIEVVQTTTPLRGGPYIINNDFFLRDNEIGAISTTLQVGGTDTVPGLIIRSRAQNTWTRTN